MISSCVSYLTGLERSFAMNAIVALVATAFFVGSSTTGLKRGMNFLAASEYPHVFYHFVLYLPFRAYAVYFEYGHGSFRLHADQFYPQQHAGQYGIYE